MAPQEADLVGEKMKEGFAKVQPIPRAAEPDDIAQCVAWLASDRSTFVNGTDIVVDGGLIGVFSQQQDAANQIKKSLGL